NFSATFRVTGRSPELWHAETGSIQPLSFTTADGRTSIPLHLEPWGTALIVFRAATPRTSRQLPTILHTQLATVDGPWTVSFQPGRGAPSSIQMKELIDWSKSDDSGVKYFSGVATYTNHFDVEAGWL